ncbi:UDP-N-acetylmuramate dehydrogenase [Pikeienuella piscinae]|uniref:UDP-N-acetylenolpyruvoylglucosamine reductase n=1 Tax=Pikeienuella piscinae TaxID=2748098 RepID=A0A7M3T6M3_9RHOB|nr:UDP-N-acetylmuramate dehydrogenase [Pikeienuella piscinae]QIE57654.1 UDP-N-acetylmuramate dehydrogenase [Pikeienuella piscinae]
MSASLDPDFVARFGARLTSRRPLADLTWLRVGGPAEWLFTPQDAGELAAFLAGLDPGVPVTPIGVGSNLIVRDGGVGGVVIRLAGRGFGGVEPLPGARLRAGAGMLDAAAAKAAAKAGIGGLEFLRTIPGAVGGAAAMNAGCYGTYMADVVESVEAVTRDGRRVTLSPDDMSFGYRSSAPPDGAIVTAVTLMGAPEAPEAIEARMAEALAKRAATQPVDERTAGSTFRNPAGFSSTGRDDHGQELMAWRLIDEAGCRGLRLGGAVMNVKHSNFLTNAGGASAADLENLGEMVRERVLKSSGMALEWEIRRIGDHPAA